MSLARHFIGSCTAEGVPKKGSTAALPIPKAATPPALRKVRRDGPVPRPLARRPAPCGALPVSATRTPPVSRTPLHEQRGCDKGFRCRDTRLPRKRHTKRDYGTIYEGQSAFCPCHAAVGATT